MTDPGPTRAGLLRAVQAEARAQEREAVRRQLDRELAAAEREAAKSPRPGSTSHGHRATGLRHALAVLGADLAGDPSYPWAEQLGWVSTSCDALGVGLADPTYTDGTDDVMLEPFPVRLCAVDGGDDTTAHVYLSVAEARAVYDLLGCAIRLAIERAAATGLPEDPDA